MNNGIKRISTPESKNDNDNMNSFATNQYGDILLLTGEGKIKFTTLEKKFQNSADEEVVYDLLVDKNDLFESCRFTNIEFNADGTVLLLWSSQVYIFIYMYIAIFICIHIYTNLASIN